MKELNKTDQYESLAHLCYLLRELGLKSEPNLPSPMKLAIFNVVLIKIMMRKVRIIKVIKKIEV